MHLHGWRALDVVTLGPVLSKRNHGHGRRCSCTWWRRSCKRRSCKRRSCKRLRKITRSSALVSRHAVRQPPYSRCSNARPVYAEQKPLPLELCDVFSRKVPKSLRKKARKREKEKLEKGERERERQREGGTLERSLSLFPRFQSPLMSPPSRPSSNSGHLAQLRSEKSPKIREKNVGKKHRNAPFFSAHALPVPRPLRLLARPPSYAFSSLIPANLLHLREVLAGKSFGAKKVLAGKSF